MPLDHQHYPVLPEHEEECDGGERRPAHVRPQGGQLQVKQTESHEDCLNVFISSSADPWSSRLKRPPLVRKCCRRRPCWKEAMSTSWRTCPGETNTFKHLAFLYICRSDRLAARGGSWRGLCGRCGGATPGRGSRWTTTRWRWAPGATSSTARRGGSCRGSLRSRWESDSGVK